jgi:hypothetical protein
MAEAFTSISGHKTIELGKATHQLVLQIYRVADKRHTYRTPRLGDLIAPDFYIEVIEQISV